MYGKYDIFVFKAKFSRSLRFATILLCIYFLYKCYILFELYNLTDCMKIFSYSLRYNLVLKSTIFRYVQCAKRNQQFFITTFSQIFFFQIEFNNQLWVYLMQYNTDHIITITIIVIQLNTLSWVQSFRQL